jgi:hypothetical protein
MKMKERNTFLFRGNKRTLYFMMLVALLAVGAIGYLLVPTSGTVTAQSSDRDVQNLESFAPVGSNELATPDMIRTALSNRTGNLSDLFSSVSQLPCTEVGGEELGGRLFSAGVYCVSSARLAGEMILDGGNDASAIFIFNVKGSFEAMRESNISLINEAKSYNVFFVADNALIGEGSNFGASILAKNAIEVNSTARVTGKTLSVSGKVNAPEVASPDGGGNGNIEICKRVVTTPTNTGNLANAEFEFEIRSVPAGTLITVARVRAGFCTSDIVLPAGPYTIIERSTAFLSGGGTTTNFALVDVRALSANPTTGGSSLGTFNLATKTANITIGGEDSTSLNQLAVEFVNRFAITGFIEICKRAANTFTTTPGGVFDPTVAGIVDPDVQGTFRFTIGGVFIPGSNTILQVFTVAVGQCTGSIAVTLPFDNPLPPGVPPVPRTANAVVTELGEAGFVCVGVTTLPASRLVPPVLFTPPPGGCTATVTVVEGGVASETIVNFFNRSRPGQLKVCKVAGPGVPLNTLFTFRVRGQGPTNGQGVIGAVDRTFVVAAGPAPGGSCAFVPGFGAGNILPGDIVGSERQTFVIGSIILTDELLPVTIGGNSVLVSSITTTSTFAPGSPSLTGKFGDIFARRDIVEITYTNFVFRPTILKVCKIAGPGVALNTPFTFDVTLANPVGGGINPPFTVPVTVNAGPAGPQGGNCVIVPTVNGSMSLLGGAFNQGSTVTITERAAGNTVVSNITSETSILPPFVAGQRTTTLSGEFGIVAGVTEVTFTNTGTGPTPTPTPLPTTCTPSTTVTEGDLFPGGIVSFGVMGGVNSVTVDHVNAGTGLQQLTVMGVPSNAVVNIPAFAPGTFNPVVVTFTISNPALPVDFTLRSASTFHAAFIRVRCNLIQ